MNVVILSVVRMIKQAWAKLFTNFTEAKMIVLELDKERRGVYESDKVWDSIINHMYECEMMQVSDDIKIQNLIKFCNIKLMFPLSEAVKRDRMVKLISSTRDKILYYQNNPEQEEE